MSGGHFDYKQYHFNDIADEIINLIHNNNKKNEWGYSYDFKEETIKKFYEAEKILRLAAMMSQRIDWLVSGDDGENDFHERWDEEKQEIEK